MPNYFVNLELEDSFVKSRKEDYQESDAPFKQNAEHLEEHHQIKDSELKNNHDTFGSEDDEHNYYILRDNNYNDSRLLILLIIGSLISLGILVNSILT
jgi:hypothetical protein